ncbi:MAG: hypothetical protein HZA50_16160 [Planctomycetes bacterium]|nr:hypothetical protein [Planctomycetota bacterium]
MAKPEEPAENSPGEAKFDKRWHTQAKRSEAWGGVFECVNKFTSTPKLRFASFEGATCRVCPLQQQNNESAILIGRGIRESCRFCHGANGDLETYSMTICPQVPLRTAAAVLRFTWGYYLPDLWALTAVTQNPQGGPNCPARHLNNAQLRFWDKNPDIRNNNGPDGK